MAFSDNKSIRIAYIVLFCLQLLLASAIIACLIEYFITLHSPWGNDHRNGVKGYMLAVAICLQVLAVVSIGISVLWLLDLKRCSWRFPLDYSIGLVWYFFTILYCSLIIAGDRVGSGCGKVNAGNCAKRGLLDVFTFMSGLVWIAAGMLNGYDLQTSHNRNRKSEKIIIAPAYDPANIPAPYGAEVGFNDHLADPKHAEPIYAEKKIPTPGTQEEVV